jgi:hypothetical protein
MLAYITPEEAQLLRDRGGSGMPDPETGVPSFAPVSEYPDIYDYGNVTQEPAQQLSSFACCICRSTSTRARCFFICSSKLLQLW